MMFLPLTFLMTLDAEMLKPGDHARSLKMGEQMRTYHVHIPPNHDVKKPAPLVIALHGAAMNGKMMKLFCDLDKKASEAGFIVVYPDGTGTGSFLTWNAGLRLGGAKFDDVAFIGKMIDDLSTVATIDSKRVYATGMSNGGMMSYRLAAELSDRIAAIAPVAGTMAIPKAEPKRPVSVIHFHGTADTLVPYKTREGWGMFLKGVEDSITIWVKANGCANKPETKEVVDGKKDGLKVTRTSYLDGKEGAEVVLYTVEDGGHTWPGGKINLGFLGKNSKVISANDLMWEFFKKHPMK